MTALFSALALLPFYLLGAFPTGYLVAKRAGIDITAQGSGNVGATNVGRVLGKKAGLTVLAGDIAKGLLGIVLAYLLSPIEWFPGAAGAALVAGHCISIPGKLRGGKGVATGAAVALSLAPLAGASGLIVFALVFLWKRTVSLASVLAALTTPLAAMLWGYYDWQTLSLVAVAVLIVGRHHQNIHRLILGTEPRYEVAKLKS